MPKGIPYSLSEFINDNPTYDHFYAVLYRTRSINRGLPEIPSEYAQAIRAMFIHGPIPMDTTAHSTEILSKLAEGHKQGFIELDEEQQYTFNSPLHQQILQWMLVPRSD